jgi:hypothetical protein
VARLQDERFHAWIIARKRDDQASTVLRLCDDPWTVAGLPRFVRCPAGSELHGSGRYEDSQRDPGHDDDHECPDEH